MALRYAMAPQLDGIDDAGYLESAQLVSRGSALDNLFPLFRTRVGMAYPFGWLLRAHLLAPDQFWILTTVAEAVTLGALFAGARWLTGTTKAGLAALLLYGIYPFAVQQSAMFYPTAFQTMFIAVAMALLIGAERGVFKQRTIAMIGAGAALGLAYLVKEDAALLVPAIAAAAILTRFRFLNPAAVVWICIGAASIFFVESVTYFITTGSATFRLTATSALEGGSQISTDLQISDIFKPDAFLRSLFIVPVQVGILWWLLVPALWIAFRRGDARIRFVALLLVIVAAYLQFGSASFSKYAPLPKTPRYTAIVTPLLIMLIANWMSCLFASGRRLAATTVIVAMVAVAIPCLIFLNITSSERSRNSFSVAKVLQTLPPGPVYSNFFSVRALRVLAPEREMKTWYHANFQRNEVEVRNSPNQDNGAYVLLDLQSSKIYTSAYEMPLPAEVTEPHPNWVVVWKGQAYESDSLGRRLLEGIRSMTTNVVPESALRQRVQRSIADIIDGDEVTLFRVQ